MNQLLIVAQLYHNLTHSQRSIVDLFSGSSVTQLLDIDLFQIEYALLAAKRQHERFLLPFRLKRFFVSHPIFLDFLRRGLRGISVLPFECKMPFGRNGAFPERIGYQ